jgi:hypothetical protein
LETFPETSIQTQDKSTCKRKNEEEHKKLTKSHNWALGGSIAKKPIWGSASLSSPVNVLSHPVSQSFKMQTDGWTTAQQLQIYTMEEPPPPASKHNSFIINEYLCAITVPIDIQVDRKKHAGKVSSFQSHPAKVWLFEDGKEVVNKWVAKFQFLDSNPNVSSHASDAITYFGFALILAEFKYHIRSCLEGPLLLKGSQIEVIW